MMIEVSVGLWKTVSPSPYIFEANHSLIDYITKFISEPIIIYKFKTTIYGAETQANSRRNQREKKTKDIG